MEQTYLPGKIRERIQDLMKSNKVMQAELAARIGVSESSLSRFISGKTDKLGGENRLPPGTGPGAGLWGCRHQPHLYHC